MRDTTGFIDQNTQDCIEVCPGSLIGRAVRTGGITTVAVEV